LACGDLRRYIRLAEIFGAVDDLMSISAVEERRRSWREPRIRKRWLQIPPGDFAADLSDIGLARHVTVATQPVVERLRRESRLGSIAVYDSLQQLS
jgi:hypothetical protein